MEPLWKLLGVTQGLTAVIGSGGKTSLLYELAEELRPCGTVLLEIGRASCRERVQISEVAAA